jgi:peptidyl-prolyl cis-trans isomerase C
VKEDLVRQLYVEKYLKEKVSDAAVKAEYDKLKKDNKGVEEIHASHILVKTEDEAKQVIKDLDNGSKFGDLAKERSQDPSGKNGGDIGYIAKTDPILPAFTDALFKLKPGTYTKDPVHTQLGWHVIYAEDKRDRTVPDLKDIQDRIRKSLAQQAVQGLIQSLSAKADIKRYDMNGKPITGNAVQ